MPVRLSIHGLENEHSETETMYALDEWTPLDELAVLFGADNPDELHRRLVMLPTVPGNTSDTFVLWCLFHHFHDGNPKERPPQPCCWSPTGVGERRRVA